MIIAVSGPREPFPGTDKLVNDWIDTLPLETVIRHGNAKGVDRLARDRAKSRGIKVISIEPNYSQYPSWVAPLIRNAEIISEAEQVHGFWHGRPEGGTLNTMWLCQRLLKIPPVIHIIDPRVSPLQAGHTFQQVCLNPPAHWLQALEYWRVSVLN